MEYYQETLYHKFFLLAIPIYPLGILMKRVALLQTLIMTKAIQESFLEILQTTDWIDNETKQLASGKVKEMTLRIGYPDFILVPHQLSERLIDVRFVLLLLL